MLASSNLPIGSYTYSQGVEAAIEEGLIYDEASGCNFLQAYMTHALVKFELPLLGLIVLSIGEDDSKLTLILSQIAYASRETKEFSFESQQLSHALSAWLDEVLQLNVPNELTQTGFLPLFAHVAHYCEFGFYETLMAYGFGQLENMVLAMVKTVPLGQMAGQRILWQLPQDLEQHVKLLEPTIVSIFHKRPWQLSAIEQANDLITTLRLSSSMPYLSALSCQHERQYSRLFRS